MKVCNILKILSSKYSIENADSKFNYQEQQAAESVEKYLLEITKSGKIPQSYIDLDFKGSDLFDDSSDSDDSDATDNENDEYIPETENNSALLPYSLDQMKNILAYYDDPTFTGNRLRRVKMRFRRIKTACQIFRMRKYVNNSGSRLYKVRQLDKRLFQQFLSWKQAKQVVRDRFLVDTALVIAENLKFREFMASDSWLLSFKRRHRIVSRKITKVVTAKEPNAEANIEKVAQDFVKNVQLTINDKHKTPDKVFNTDQMGIQLEMTSGRTLAIKGEKQISAAVQSKNATTHSLTIQPLINAYGKLFTPVLICFKEPNGAPRCFERDLLKFKNLRCFWTRSGKVTSDMMKKWMKDDFIPVAPRRSILLLDSWPGFAQAKELPEVQRKNIGIITIPPKTTGKVQPLDVGFNRYFKAFYRTLADKIRRLHPKYMLAKRAHIGCLLNQTIEQFCAPRFTSLISHSFIKPGYFNHEYEPYETPDSYCFNFSTVGARCEVRNCRKLAFIRCAWCENYICFDHFIDKLHCCRN